MSKLDDDADILFGWYSESSVLLLATQLREEIKNLNRRARDSGLSTGISLILEIEGVPVEDWSKSGIDETKFRAPKDWDLQ